MNLFSDIITVFTAHWPLIAVLWLLVLLGFILTRGTLKWILGERLASEEYMSLAAAGWILPVLLTSFLWLGWGMVQRSNLSAWIVLICLAILSIVISLRGRNGSDEGSKVILYILLTFFVLFLFLRLALVSKAILPLYFDSAQHYLNTKALIGMITSEQGMPFAWPLSSYYHIAFHILTAWVTSLSQVDISSTMLLLGQVILAAIPLPLFTLIRQETRSDAGGLFAVLLATFGWYMPAYAVNWGKYPALTSLPLTTFVIGLAYLSLRYKDSLPRRNYLALNLILLLGILVATLTHSRAIFVFGIVGLSWMLTAGWQRLPKLLRAVAFLALLAGCISVILFIRKQAIFGLLFDPYWEKGLVITAVVLILGLFALWHSPRLVFAIIASFFLLLVCLIIPINVPGYGQLTLLDRPFVEMFIYLPLSILGGAGLAGLERSLRSLNSKWQADRVWPVHALSSLFLIGLAVNAVLHYNLYPSDCCHIIGRDDLVAIDWMDKNLPSEARILIASTELHVLATDTPQGIAGSDGGIWITPLTGRLTIPMPYQSDFGQPAVFDIVCRQQADYLYVGETGAIFNNALIAPYPDRYHVLLSMPTAKVYQVTGCPPV